MLCGSRAWVTTLRAGHDGVPRKAFDDAANGHKLPQGNPATAAKLAPQQLPAEVWHILLCQNLSRWATDR
jgi:hypothetical protein